MAWWDLFLSHRGDKVHIVGSSVVSCRNKQQKKKQVVTGHSLTAVAQVSYNNVMNVKWESSFFFFLKATIRGSSAPCIWMQYPNNPLHKGITTNTLSGTSTQQKHSETQPLLYKWHRQQPSMTHSTDIQFMSNEELHLTCGIVLHFQSKSLHFCEFVITFNNSKWLKWCFKQ